MCVHKLAVKHIFKLNVKPYTNLEFTLVNSARTLAI